MSEKQQTISAAASLKGKGVHTGANVTVTIKPAPVNHGVVFCRTDMEGQPTIKADVDFVTGVDRSTTLTNKEASVSTVEHLMAALWGMGVDNALIDIDGPEMPIMDGSAKPFVDAIEAAGVTAQDAERQYYIVKENILFNDAEKGVQMIAVPSDTFKLTVMVDYNSHVLGLQYATLDNRADFKTEIAPCRTFAFLHELKYLLEHNLVKGGDVNNALVIVEKGLEESDITYLKKAFNVEDISVTSQGYLNNVDIHFDNEPARHKLLDIIGDLGLIGKPIKAHVIAFRPGHASNVGFGKKIKELIRRDKSNKNPAPKYDHNVPPVYDINRIMATLPHRPPFLLVDKIIEMSETHIIGVKNITMNEPFFEGHFPGNPVMPGVLQVEAMAQAGGILALSTVADPENYSTYFLRIDGVRFRDKVMPGDTLVFKLTLTEPIRRGIVQMHGEAFVGDKLVMEADLMAQIVKEKNL